MKINATKRLKASWDGMINRVAYSLKDPVIADDSVTGVLANSIADELEVWMISKQFVHTKDHNTLLGEFDVWTLRGKFEISMKRNPVRTHITIRSLS